MERLIQLGAVRKIYSPGEYQVEALKGIDLSIRHGEYLAVMGASGSGKSTLMNIMGCLDTVTSGEYVLDGTNVADLDRDDYAEVRNRKIGFVFQGFHLLARTTALENVELPLFYGHHVKKSEYSNRAEAALKKVGLGDRMFHEPNQLSGGQQQRVAIARALVNEPALLLADEPTGNLDTATSLEIISIFQELNETGMTVILVTHEPDIAMYAKRIITLRDGLLVNDRKVRGRRNARRDLEAFVNKNRMSHLSAKEAASS
ncbi:MAG: ABC transporter ATP-binding protein [Spirochaetaceae bacterium]|nr:MAG: ABC transporter ATP-binding protein [Spirochaetaceae bacterium]